MTWYARVTQLVSFLDEAGAVHEAETLRDAHVGVFNGTELFMKWRFLVEAVLARPDLAPDVRTAAQRLCEDLDQELS